MLDLTQVTAVISATSAAVDLFDKIAGQVKSVLTKQPKPKKQELEGEEKWGLKIHEDGDALVMRQEQGVIQIVTASELTTLPPEHLSLIQTYQETMERNYRLWQAIYKRRDASPDPLVNAQVEEELIEQIRKMKRDLTGIIDFLLSIGLHLDDHYMAVRYLVEHA
jgi:hypothetical protein